MYFGHVVVVLRQSMGGVQFLSPGTQVSEREQGRWSLCPPVGESCWLILCQPGSILRLPALSSSAALLSTVVLLLNKTEVEAIIDRRPWLLTAQESQFSPRVPRIAIECLLRACVGEPHPAGGRLCWGNVGHLSMYFFIHCRFNRDTLSW